MGILKCHTFIGGIVCTVTEDDCRSGELKILIYYFSLLQWCATVNPKAKRIHHTTHPGNKRWEDLCKRVILNFKKRVGLCLERDGGQLEHIYEIKT